MVDTIDKLNVQWDKLTGKAVVTYGGSRSELLGRYRSYEDAVVAAQTYARRHWGYTS